jgi:hypothetical protein
VDELAVELGDLLGVLEHDLGHERPGLEIPSTLQLEQVSFGADDRALGESLEEARLLTGRSAIHGRTSDLL